MIYIFRLIVIIFITSISTAAISQEIEVPDLASGILYASAETAYKNKEYKKAFAYFDKIANDDPKNILYSNMAGISALNISNYKAAIDHLERGINNLEGMADNQKNLATMYRNHSIALSHDKQPKKAISAAEEAMKGNKEIFRKDNEETAVDLRVLAIANHGSGDPDKAFKLFKNALEILDDKKLRDLPKVQILRTGIINDINNMGYTLEGPAQDFLYLELAKSALLKKDYNEAIKNLDLTIAVNDNVPLYYDLRANTHFRLNNMTYAVKDFMFAVDRSLKNGGAAEEKVPEYFFKAGSIYIVLNDTYNAIKYLKAAEDQIDKKTTEYTDLKIQT